MTDLESLAQQQVDDGRVPGAVAAFARPGEDADNVEVVAVGRRSVDGAAMTRDTLFRLASVSKPITAAAALALVDRGRIALDDPIEGWIPELANPMVLRDPAGAFDDPDNLEPADTPITVRHLLTLQGGHGLPSQFDLPIVARLFADGLAGPPQPQHGPTTEERLARLAELPLLHHPGNGWTYDTGIDLLGILLARAEDSTLFDVLHDTILGPLGMDDTSFHVGSADRARLVTRYAREDGTLTVVDPPDGQWAQPPRFASGASGLVSTVDDCLAFAAMVLAGGAAPDGTTVLQPDTVAAMTSAQVPPQADNIFLSGQAWGFGGGVDVAEVDPWNVPGRYGWIGGSGTALYVVPSAGTAMVWLGQVELGGPQDFGALGSFLTWGAQRSGR